MRYPPEILDDIRSRLPVSQIVSRRVPLKRQGREYRGLSPFKQERTPSFFVNDQKGFYHCFASGEHGDIFKFLMTTEGLTFPEAVERLAEEAGVSLPKPGAAEMPEQRDHRARLYDLLEQAAKFFEATLAGREGAAGRAYLDGRGVKPDTRAEFRLGLAPASRIALKSRLSSLGFSSADMIETGMLIAGEDIKEPYDRFRERVMFPIMDMKGRVIAFGGRALKADVPAKYLNSPETPLFHKGAILFNAHRARGPAHDARALIVVEGYMDVVALWEGGFKHAVAPLGTALTPEQVKLTWRMCPEPTLCFDGDSAGIKAAYRAVETTLPLASPGFSVKFAFLPHGQDPDDLIRAGGADAMATELGKTRGLFDVLWEREAKGLPLTAPEARAAFEARVMALVKSIADPTVRQHYEQEARNRLFALSRTSGGPGRAANRFGARTSTAATRGQGKAGTQGQGRSGFGGPSDWRDRDRKRTGLLQPFAQGGTQAPTTQQSRGGDAAPYREALMLRALLNHPWLIEAHAEAIADAPLTSPALIRLRQALLETLAQHEGEISLDTNALRTHLESLSLGGSLELVDRAVSHKSDRFAESHAEAAQVQAGFVHVLALQHQHRLREALAAAERDWEVANGAEAQDLVVARIIEIQRQLAGAASCGDIFES